MYKWLILILLSGLSTQVLANSNEKELSQVQPEEVQQETKIGDKLVLGEKEWVYVDRVNKNFRARIDTGAATSSINADVLEVKKEKGKRSQVTFKLQYKDWQSEAITLPVTRWADVKQSSTEELDKRAVVTLDIQIGKDKIKTDFSLVDRSHLSYPILIGRTFIDERAVVDVSHKYIQEKVKLKKEEKTEDKSQSDKDNAKVNKSENNDDQEKSDKKEKESSNKSETDK